MSASNEIFQNNSTNDITLQDARLVYGASYENRQFCSAPPSQSSWLRKQLGASRNTRQIYKWLPLHRCRNVVLILGRNFFQKWGYTFAFTGFANMLLLHKQCKLDLRISSVFFAIKNTDFSCYKLDNMHYSKLFKICVDSISK